MSLWQDFSNPNSGNNHQHQQPPQSDIQIAHPPPAYQTNSPPPQHQQNFSSQPPPSGFASPTPGAYSQPFQGQPPQHPQQNYPPNQQDSQPVVLNVVVNEQHRHVMNHSSDGDTGLGVCLGCMCAACCCGCVIM